MLPEKHLSSPRGRWARGGAAALLLLAPLAGGLLSHGCFVFPAVSQEEYELTKADGEKIYQAYCTFCHQRDLGHNLYLGEYTPMELRRGAYHPNSGELRNEHRAKVLNYLLAARETAVKTPKKPGEWVDFKGKIVKRPPETPEGPK